MEIKIEQSTLPLNAPFTITGHTFTDQDIIRVTLKHGHFIGHGEASGVYYKDETSDSMIKQLNEVGDNISAGVSHEQIQSLLPSGGARNALDCALWDLEAKRSGKSVWQRLNLKAKALSSVTTISIASPETMAATASRLVTYPSLKIKLSGDQPIEKLEAIRAARPDARLIVDVNQGWNMAELIEYLPACARLGIAMVEQPLPRGADEELEGFKSPVPLGADESCLDVSEYEIAARRYDVINIKLDKCGGLTEGLKLVKLAQRDNKTLMIGNMVGTSLAMAPAYVIGQFCEFIDIDGPLFLQQDTGFALDYSDGGMVSVPSPALWG